VLAVCVRRLSVDSAKLHCTGNILDICVGCCSPGIAMNLHTAGKKVDQSARCQRRSVADCQTENTVRCSSAHDANICHQYVDGEDEGFRYIFFSNDADNNNNNNWHQAGPLAILPCVFLGSVFSLMAFYTIGDFKKIIIICRTTRSWLHILYIMWYSLINQTTWINDGNLTS